MPSVFRNMVRAVAGNKQVPEELPAMFGLGAMATVVARFVEIARGSGWKEPLNLYLAVSMDSGTGKSPAEKDVIRPVWEIEKRLRAEHVAVTNNKIDQLALERGGVAGKGPSAANRIEDDLKALEEERATLPDLILGSDTTPEKLSEHMSRNDGVGAIIDSEGEFFPMLSGRYSSGTPNVGIVLKAYDGDRYKVGRIGRKQADIDRAVLTLALAVQPVVLEDAVKNKVMLERGLLARFLFAVPPSLLGTRADEGEPYDFEAMKAWDEAIESLYDYVSRLKPNDHGEMPLLILSARARVLHVRFCGWIERRLHPDSGDLGDMPGWAAKHKARALRIAGLLHLVEGFRLEHPVSEATMRAAVEVCRWAIGHAVQVFKASSQLEQQEQRCADVMDWVRTKGVREFVLRDAARGVCKKWVREEGTDALLEVLNLLCEEGHLGVTHVVGRTGRSRAVYRPHPLALEVAKEVKAA